MANAPDLTKLAQETEQTLRGIHVTIGLSSAETDERLKQLVEDVSKLYFNTVADTKKEREDLETAIVDKTKTIRETAAQLCDGDDVETQLKSISQTNLRATNADLDKILNTLNEKKSQRLSTLNQLLHKLLSVYAELAIAAPSPYDQVGQELSLSKISQFEAENQRLDILKHQRIEEIGFLMATIEQLWGEMGIPRDQCTAEIDQKILSRNNDANTRTFDLSAETIARLQRRRDELEAEKHNRLAEIDRLSKLILALWNLLEISEAERVQFSAQVDGLSLDIIQKYGVELNRLEVLKVQKMGELIIRTRAQLTKLWDEMKVGEADRRMFAPYFSDVFTEQALAVHEAEVKRMEERKESLRVLFDNVQKRDAIKQKIAACKIISADPTRFQRRDLSKILKEEEECRKLKETGLPKLEAKIMDDIKLWENAHNEPFLIEGTPYVEIILRDQEEQRQEDAAKKTTRKENADHANVPTPKKAPPGSASKKGAKNVN